MAQLKEAIWDCGKLLREWECHCVSSVHHSVIFFVHCKCDLWKAFSAKNPDGRSVWRHATQDGELRQTGSKCHRGLSGVLFWRCRLMIGSLSRRVLAGLGSPVRSRKEKSCCSVLKRGAPAAKRRADSDSCSRDGPSLCLLGCAFAIDSLLFCLIFLLEWTPLSLCRC